MRAKSQGRSNIAARSDWLWQSQYRKCESLRTRNDGVDLEILLGRVGIAADRSDGTERVAADASGKSGVCASTGELTLHAHAEILRYGRVGFEQCTSLGRLRQWQEFAEDLECC